MVESPMQTETKPVEVSGVTLGQVRKKVWTSLTPAVARDVGISLSDVEKFLTMQRTPPRETLQLLARRLGMT
jgi:hypothetical protein